MTRWSDKLLEPALLSPIPTEGTAYVAPDGAINYLSRNTTKISLLAELWSDKLERGTHQCQALAEQCSALHFRRSAGTPLGFKMRTRIWLRWSRIRRCPAGRGIAGRG